jgi:branched-chain amino acid transport system substrate-binding protein
MSDRSGMGLRRLAAVAAGALALVACGAQQTSTQQAKTVPGVTNDTISLGATYPLSGSATPYAAIAVGSNAYFQYVNDHGGVNGRKIKYTVLDDQYLPANTPAKTRELVEVDKIFAAFGTLGTAPNASVRPYYNQNQVPQLFVFTGASIWGSEYKQYPWTIGWQPDYQTEAKIYAKHVLQSYQGAKIGVLYQNDAYGQDYLAGFKAGLGSAADSMIVKTATYNAGDPVNLASQVTTLKDSGADLFFCVTTPSYSASALTQMVAQGWKPKAVIVNAVGADALTMTKVATSLGSSAGIDGAITTVYAKDPNDPRWSGDKGFLLYKQILRRSPTSYGFTCVVENIFCLIGMASAYTMVDVLKKAGKDLTRQSVMDLACCHLNETDNPFLLPSLAVKTTSSDHFPIRQAQLERWQTNRYVAFGSVIDTRGS